ncbi:MAG: DinB family protein [Bacteroidetes bacterium]|nr:DinB family protein [Bacteroidota bacterium]
MNTEQRNHLERRLKSASDTVESLFERYTEEQLTQKPAQHSWSAVECVAHLNITMVAVAPLLKAAIHDLRSKNRTTVDPSRMDWMGRAVNWFLKPPPRFKTTTAASFQPLSVDSCTEELKTFRKNQIQLIEILGAADGLRLSERKIVSPFDHRVKYNAYSMLCIVVTHEERHIWQAQLALKNCV